MSGPKNPVQPIVVDSQGVVRFKANALVSYLLDAGGLDMNKLTVFASYAKVSLTDQEQFAQLIGYSVSGFGDLSYAQKETVREADRLAAVLVDQPPAAKDNGSCPLCGAHQMCSECEASMNEQEQPAPIPSTAPATWDLVLADTHARDEFGARKYGVRHQPHNGRDQLRDAYEEALDLVCYLRAAIYEKENVAPEVREAFAEIVGWCPPLGIEPEVARALGIVARALGIERKS